jgi:hypothetical protein
LRVQCSPPTFVTCTCWRVLPCGGGIVENGAADDDEDGGAAEQRWRILCPRQALQGETLLLAVGKQVLQTAIVCAGLRMRCYDTRPQHAVHARLYHRELSSNLVRFLGVLFGFKLRGCQHPNNLPHRSG